VPLGRRASPAAGDLKPFTAQPPRTRSVVLTETLAPARLIAPLAARQHLGRPLWRAVATTVKDGRYLGGDLEECQTLGSGHGG
jgi:hypothetical protein